MRSEFHAELAEVKLILVEMAEAARQAISHASRALLTADTAEAEEVVVGDLAIDALHSRAQELIYELLARQAPVAGDLRTVITSLHVAADLERMGDLAKHVAETASRRAPAVAVPEELRPVIREMGEVADQIAGKIVEVLNTTDAARAAELESDDDVMDELHRQLLALMLGSAWRHGAEQAIDGALLGRYMERYADHAVNAARQIIYLRTGS